MKKITQLLILVSIGSFIFYSCSSEYDGYNKTESGIHYKFYIQTDSTKMNVGDEITFHLKYTLNDSVVFDTKRNQSPDKKILPKSQYSGDIYECFTLMSVGDSACFILEADSFFLITANQPSIPPSVKKGSKMFADVKILNIKPKEEVEEDRLKMFANIIAEENKNIEDFKDYKKITDEFIENSGIFYKEIKKGSGNLPKPTDYINVNYKIERLDGSLFWSKDNMFFECMGENFETEGFNMILSKMRKGEKGSFIVPSNLALGEKGLKGRLSPFSPLFYTIEILDIQNIDDYNTEHGDEENKLQDAEYESIANYLNENNITKSPRASGLYYIEKEKGNGMHTKIGDKVKVHYTLYSLAGKKIDSSIDKGIPFEFVIGNGEVIKGWDEALTLMRVGGKATLIIPSKIAYQDRKRSEDILPYTPLLFEVELLEIVK